MHTVENTYQFFLPYTDVKHDHVSLDILVSLLHCDNVDRMMEFCQLSSHHFYQIRHISQTVKHFMLNKSLIAHVLTLM